MMRHQMLGFVAAAVLAASGNLEAYGQAFWSEDFEGVTLGNSVNERISTGIATLGPASPGYGGSSPVPGVWSASAPSGWTVDNTLSVYDGAATVTPGVPGVGLADYGVDEWQGWTFSRLDFWSDAAGAQDREQFGTTSNAAGTVAVVDPDEYFDLGSQNDPVNGGYYSSSLTTKSFSVNAGQPHWLGFDSSWRDESFDDEALGSTIIDQNNQSVEIIATFDVGGSVQVTKWNSNPVDPDFKNDAPDEGFAADGTSWGFVAPAGATTATISFNIANAANDWWWAIDNIEVNGVVGAADNKLFEDFEGITLGDSVNERLLPGSNVTVPSAAVNTIAGVDYPTQAIPNAFTHTAAGWNIDNTGTPSVGDDDVGVFEWEGWSFANKDFWNDVAGQGRGDFANASGNVAVADGDEWDDLGNPDGDGGVPMLTLLESPSINLSPVNPGQQLLIEFASSWRAEDDQTAVLTALLDGNPVELLRWESDGASAFFHDDNTNEAVRLLLDPAGASSLVLQFNYSGTDDWWWAIDNVQVSAIPEPSSIAMAGISLGLAIAGFRRRNTK